MADRTLAHSSESRQREPLVYLGSFQTTNFYPFYDDCLAWFGTYWRVDTPGRRARCDGPGGSALCQHRLGNLDVRLVGADRTREQVLHEALFEAVESFFFPSIRNKTIRY